MQNHIATLNNGKHINRIVEETACGKHGAPKGVACWGVETKIVEHDTSERIALAVCGRRIKKAGYNGKISPTSLQLKVAGGRGRSPRPQKRTNASK